MTRQIVAAFDFDGTLTYHDTLIPFLRYCKGTWPSLWNLALASPYLLIYFNKREFRQRVKEQVLRRFLGGMPLSEVKVLGEGFARDDLPKHIRPEALQRLKWHQSQGHRCVLVSANLDVYLDPWAKAMGFDDLVSTKLDTDARHRVTGRLVGKNCWGEEKVRRLEELLGPKRGYDLYAYGDSRGDEALLAYADHPFYRLMPLEDPA